MCTDFIFTVYSVSYVRKLLLQKQGKGKFNPHTVSTAAYASTLWGVDAHP